MSAKHSLLLFFLREAEQLKEKEEQQRENSIDLLFDNSDMNISIFLIGG